MDDFVLLLTIFMLAIFVGFEIITKVPPTLHTPLMSGANAISGITLVGAVLVAGESGLEIVDSELDECVLCDLCLEVAPGKIEIVKLYEQE